MVELRDLLLFLGRLPELTPHTLATCSSHYGNMVCVLFDFNLILYDVLKISVIQSDIRARQELITEHRCASTSSQPRFGINSILEDYCHIFP